MLLELLHVYWYNNDFAIGSGNARRLRLVSLYYGKALAFTELGYCDYALEALKQINQLKILESNWGIYPKLLNLTEMLQRRRINEHEVKEKKSGFISTIKSGITGFFSRSNKEQEDNTTNST